MLQYCAGPHSNCGEVSDPSQDEEVSMSPKKDTQKSATPALAGGARESTAAIDKKSKGFTEVEKAAMKARAQELKAEARADKDKAEGERAVLAAIAAMPEPDRAMAKRLHAIVKAGAPALSPKTWYGMPAYAKDGKVVSFFQSAQKFNSRYATFGFSDTANLDEGALWPTSFALKELTATAEARISALVKKAVS
jgi:uncharacterized protein YdhG (YjbR/CyaY superfamily)